MNNFVFSRVLQLALCSLLFIGFSPAWADPVVDHVIATQRSGTQLVDITYDVAAPGFTEVTIFLEISADEGTTWTVPANSVTGDIGEGVSVGTAKKIVWNAGKDWPGGYSTKMQFRVLADDGVDPPIPSDLVLIPGGSFTMGPTSGDVDANFQEPTEVTLNAFYMAETTTTKAQWDEVRAWAVTNGYSDLALGRGKAEDHPVYLVSWFDVVKWCNARSEKEGLAPVYRVNGFVYRTGNSVPEANWAANGYRLPTEAEWEKAARGGVEGKRFPWGTDEISHALANYIGSGGDVGGAYYDQSQTGAPHPAYDDGVRPYTNPVKDFAANGYGLYDMAGNVWEWCWDWNAPNYYGSETNNPHGPVSGTVRITRGGAWVYNATFVTCARRYSWNPLVRNDTIGFRIVRIQNPL